MKRLNLEQLADLRELITERLDDLPAVDHFGRGNGEREIALNALRLDLIKDHGAIVRSMGDATITLAGIRSTSTSGLAGALRNWVVAADRRLADGGV